MIISDSVISVGPTSLGGKIGMRGEYYFSESADGGVQWLYITGEPVMYAVLYGGVWHTKYELPIEDPRRLQAERLWERRLVVLARRRMIGEM